MISPGSTYLPVASISAVFASARGRRPAPLRPSATGSSATICVIVPFSTTMSNGPLAGVPLPSTTIALRTMSRRGARAADGGRLGGCVGEERAGNGHPGDESELEAYAHGSIFRSPARCRKMRRRRFSRSPATTWPTFDDGEKSGWAPGGSEHSDRRQRRRGLLEPWRGTRPVTAATFLRRRTDEPELSCARRRATTSFCGSTIAIARACAKEVGLLAELHGRVAVPRRAVRCAECGGVPFVVLEFVDGISMRELQTVW